MMLKELMLSLALGVSMSASASPALDASDTTELRFLLTDIFLSVARCINSTTGESVEVIEPQGEVSVDCVEAGLDILPGDTVVLLARGTAFCGPDPCELGSDFVGAGRLIGGVCSNLATGQRVSDRAIDDGAVTCAEAGFVADDTDPVVLLLFARVIG